MIGGFPRRLRKPSIIVEARSTTGVRPQGEHRRAVTQPQLGSAVLWARAADESERSSASLSARDCASAIGPAFPRSRVWSSRITKYADHSPPTRRCFAGDSLRTLIGPEKNGAEERALRGKEFAALWRPRTSGACWRRPHARKGRAAETAAWPVCGANLDGCSLSLLRGYTMSVSLFDSALYLDGVAAVLANYSSGKMKMLVICRSGSRLKMKCCMSAQPLLAMSYSTI